MRSKSSLLLIICLVLTACLGSPAPLSEPSPDQPDLQTFGEAELQIESEREASPFEGQSQTYIEPNLRQAETETLAVIVTAGDAETAARVVEELGGTVTSELWIINAVAADIPSDRLEQLAANPDIVSVVENKGVKSSEGPEWNGWVTNYVIPVPYNGSPDAQPTEDDGIWNLANPVSIDVGADILHYDHNIRGNGVGIAVLDSGVYFENKMALRGFEG